MNIKNQIRLSVLISLILVGVISVSIIVSYQNMQVLQRQESLAADVVRGGYELTYLSNDYLINAEPRARLQWDERYVSLQPIISQLKPENEEEAQSLEIIRDYNKKIGTLFREIPEPGALSTGAVLFPTSYQQVTWSRINVQSQGVIYEAWRLRHLYNNDVSNARFWNNILVLALMAIMLVIISVNYLLISRKFVRSIREVNIGSEVFATGNLDYRIPLTSDDEIGGIARRLNTMAEQVLSVTASRDELDREIVERRKTEESLRESEEKFRQLFTQMPSAVAIYDAVDDGEDFIFKDFNITAEKIERIKKEDLIGKRVTGVFPGVKDFGIFAVFQRVWRTGRPEFFPSALYRDESDPGTWRENWVYKLASGEIIAIYEDITERRRAENELAAAQLQYRELFESINIGILRSTPGSLGTIIEANPAALRIFEADSREQLFAIHPSDLYLDPEQRRRISEEIVAKGAINSMEVRYKTLKGRAFWGSITSSKKVSDDGQVYFDNTIEDITDRKRVEEELKASEEKFSMAFKTSPYAITITRIKDERFIEVNDAFTPITGFSHEEALSGSSVGFGLWVDAEDRKRMISTLLNGRTVSGEEFLFRRKNGEIITGLFSARIISLNNEPCILSSINDISDRKRAEECLYKSEERLRFTLEATNDGIWDWDLPTGKAFFSPGWYTMLGYAPYEMPGSYETWRSLVHPDELVQAEQTIQGHIKREDTGYTLEIRMLTRQGDWKWILTRGKVVERDPKGNPIRMVGTHTDITGRKQAEDDLRESNEYLRNLLDYANAPIIVWDPEFRITRFNHAFERLTGRTEQEVIGKNLSFLFPETSRDASLGMIRKTLTGERWEVVEIPILHPSGEIRIVLWNSANIVDSGGTIISTIAQGQDITDRKRAEEALKKNELKFQTLADYTYDWAYWMDTDFKVIYTSPSCERITGFAPEGFTGNPDLTVTIMHPDDRELFIRHRSEVHDRQEHGELEFRIIHRDGSIRWIGHVCRPIIDSAGHFFGTRVSNRDITDRKTIEKQREALIRELEQKNTELEQFTYTVSHDLKSPLITIKGFAGLLEYDALKGEHLLLKNDIHRITDAADTMQALLTDLLELAQVGRIVHPREKTPFSTIAHEAVNLLAGSLAERGVTVEIAPDLPDVCVDHARIREVMSNLIENSVKFLGNRPYPVIRIGVDMKGATPVFFVQDNGIGINPRYLERIFNLFERLDASAIGTGIGLTIARRIIEVHSGKIWAESEGPGKGTTFRFTLPGPAEEGH
jgi:PAS domain S-box-containing protein